MHTQPHNNTYWYISCVYFMRCVRERPSGMPPPCGGGGYFIILHVHCSITPCISSTHLLYNMPRVSAGLVYMCNLSDINTCGTCVLHMACTLMTLQQF